MTTSSNNNNQFTNRNKFEEFYKLYFHQSEKGVWLSQFDEPLPTNLPIDQQVEHLLKHAYLFDCNLEFVKMYGYDKPEDMIGMHFPQIFDNSEIANLENLRKFLEANYKIAQIETFEIGKNAIRKCFLNDVNGIVEDGYLVRVWGIQEDITLQKSESEPENSLEKQLTPQQMSVLKLTAEGLKLKEIADELGISIKTVEYLRKCIKKKFEIETTSEMVALAIKFGIEIRKE